MERMIGFGNLALLELVSGKIDLRADASFCVFPKLFYQTLVLMAFDPQTGTRAPVARALMTGERTFSVQI